MPVYTQPRPQGAFPWLWSLGKAPWGQGCVYTAIPDRIPVSATLQGKKCNMQSGDGAGLNELAIKTNQETKETKKNAM